MKELYLFFVFFVFMAKRRKRPRRRSSAHKRHHGAQTSIRYSAATLLTFAALLHLLRAINDWQLVLNGWHIPMWVSWLTMVLGGSLAYLLVKDH